MALFKRRIKSALFIDFENVPLSPAHIGNVVAWLEDGRFSDGAGLRRFVEKRVYWNSQSQRHRAAYEAQTFDVVLVEKYAGLKNGADIRIAMDMIEATFKQRQIEEFILISKDSDFVPLIQRLGERDKRSIMMVEEQMPAAYTAYDLHADGIIAQRALLQDGQAYQRPARSVLERIGLKRRPRAAATAKSITAGTAGNGRAHGETATLGAAASTTISSPQIPGKHLNGHATTSDPSPVLNPAQLFDQAVAMFVKVSSRNPGKPTGKQTVLRQLKMIKGFNSSGGQPYLGFKTYDAMAKAVAARDSRITIQADRFGGIVVVYVPRDADITGPVAAIDPVLPAPAVAQAEKQPTP